MSLETLISGLMTVRLYLYPSFRPKFLPLFFILIAVLLSPQRASALEFLVENENLGPMGRFVTFYLEGEIKLGDAARLASEIEDTEVTPESVVSFRFNSPGGAVTEAMKIGELIDSLPHGVTTRVAGKSADAPARCASACVLAFLGGHYRYAEDRELGVHQFFYDGDGNLSGEQASSTAQVLSAEIVKYIRGMRADPELFSLMTRAFSDEIYWLPKPEAEKLRLVTGGVYDENSEYKNSDGNFYLRLWQQSRTGESKLVVWCAKAEPMFVAYLQPPKLYLNGKFMLVIDGEMSRPKNWEIARDSNTNGGRWVEVVFQATGNQLSRLARATTVGARMIFPSGKMFFGFEKRIRNRKLRDMLKGCQKKQVEGRSEESPKSFMVEVPQTDFPGGDLTGLDVKGISFDQCKRLCLEISQCQAVSWVSEQEWCWPKVSIESSKMSEGIISAVRGK